MIYVHRNWATVPDDVKARLLGVPDQRITDDVRAGRLAASVAARRLLDVFS